MFLPSSSFSFELSPEQQTLLKETFERDRLILSAADTAFEDAYTHAMVPNAPPAKEGVKKLPPGAKMAAKPKPPLPTKEKVAPIIPPKPTAGLSPTIKTAPPPPKAPAAEMANVVKGVSVIAKDQPVLGLTGEEETRRKIQVKADLTRLAADATQNLQSLTSGFKEGVVHRETLTAKESAEMAKKARQLSSAAVQRFRYTEPYIRLHQALEVIDAHKCCSSVFV